jgi:hypothetical protein
MYKFATAVVIVLLIGAAWGSTQKTDGSAHKPVSDEFRPAAEMQKLFDAFLGCWHVTETFEISAELQGKARQGTACFRTGPGASLIEDYHSTGSAGNLNGLSLLWWDQSTQSYRLLICANNDGCQLRGTSKWEGNELINSWEEPFNGKTAVFRDSFVDISPSSFRVISEGTIDRKTIWRVITKHVRLSKGKR